MSDAITVIDSCSYQLRLKIGRLQKRGYEKVGESYEEHTPINSGWAKGYSRHKYSQLMLKER